MIDIGVCEDQDLERDFIVQLLLEYIDQHQLKCKIDTFLNGFELLRKEKNYDILFLDVDMPIMNGIEVGERIRRKNKLAKIIYITGYTDYALQALGIHAFDYLIKPMTKEYLYEKIGEVFDYIQLEAKKQKLYFKKDKDLLCFDTKDIYYFEAVPSHKIRIITDEGVFEIRASIDQTIEQVKKYGFLKAHKSYIVNLEYITKIESYKIFLANNVQIPLAERMAKRFKEKFTIFLTEKMCEELS